MSDLPLAYIAGPFSDPSETIRAWHVARARLLARLALACGLAPFEPHSSIHAGVYGDDSDPEQRARGMAATAAICRGVLATPGAVLWALLRDDGMRSDGVESEVVAARIFGKECEESTWWGWRIVARDHAPDLLPEWDRLAARPDAVGEWEQDHAYSTLWKRMRDGCDIAMCDPDGWAVYPDGGLSVAEGPETGAPGRAAADAALRRAGVVT